MIIDREQLKNQDSRYRATFINSLAGVKQAVLIGTKSNNGHSNLAIFNSLIHIGANPPLWGFICRPDTIQRDTLQNILETGEYSFNFVLQTDVEKAHQTSAKYPKEESEFHACGFGECFYEGFSAPFVREAPVKIGIKFEEKIDISINGTILLIGSISFIDMDEKVIAPDGFVHLDQLKTLSCAGLDAYFDTRLIQRLSYAKIDKWPSKL
ncbi:MAG: flavin reductase family protein [Flavobacteriales bacterium]